MSELTTTSVLAELVKGAEKPNSFLNIRTEAETFLAENGIPSKKHEDWKYTNAKRLFDNGLEFTSATDCTFNSVDGVEIFWSEAEKLTGSTAIHTKEAHAALNTSVFEKVLVIRVKKGTQVSDELVLNQALELTGNYFAATRLLIELEDNASLKCQLYFTGSNASEKSLHNHVTEIFVGQNSQLEFNIVQEIAEGNLVNTTEVFCQRDANFTTNTFQLSGKLLRNNLNIRLQGENAETHLNGFYMLKGSELFDNHTLVDHLVPHCESNEVYRGILGGKSTGVFNGKVFVHPDAQKTNGYQQNNNILLTDDATMNSKPELEIYADDVRCSHGSTTGQLDEDAVFYLRARGLDEFGATALLLTAFAGEVLNSVSSEELRNILEQKIQAKLKEMRA
ncbi:MAG: Fe-S cluster assembly protein SufD [Flavobacteriales bacterium]|nr:Fe-S cluster assembly protein SufD [Flavobacteriales bacterium]